MREAERAEQLIQPTELVLFWKFMNLIDQVREWAGSLRAESFAKAAQWVLDNKSTCLVETGCYRGTPDDGRSTLILAALATANKGIAYSFELEPGHKDRALTDLFVGENEPFKHHWEFVAGDSVVKLGQICNPIQFAYLDSYDHIPEKFIECQRHQLAEVGALLGKMDSPCAILMDDNTGEHGGKVRLSVDFLRLRGWKTLHEDYQVLMVKP